MCMSRMWKGLPWYHMIYREFTKHMGSQFKTEKQKREQQQKEQILGGAICTKDTWKVKS